MINTIKSAIMRYNLRQYVIRLLSAWVVVLLFTFLSSGEPFTEKAFYEAINFPLFVIFICAFFFLACLIDKDEYITFCLICSIMVYSIFLSAYLQDYMFSFGLCMIICIVVAFSDFGKLRVHIKKQTMWIICAVLVASYTLFVGIICCLYYLNYKTPCFDFGIFAQMFYYMRETGECLTTCERDVLLSHFAVHFSPIYYLLLPVYYIFPSPCTLLIAQAFIVASAAVPLVLLCKHYKLSSMTSLAFAVCYLLYPAFLGGCYFYLHENCFLVPLIMWFIYFTEKDKRLYALILAFMTLTVKEDAPVYIAVIALYFIFTNKNYKCNLFIFAFSVIYFLSVTKLMSVYGEGIMSDSRYGAYIYDDGGLFTVIKSVLQNPAFAINQIFKEEKILFILQISVPICFMPFAIRKPAKLILLIPFILVNLMTSYLYQYDIGFQYVFGSGALLFYLAVTNFADMGKNRGKVILCSVLCSVIIFSGGYASKLGTIGNYIIDTEKRETINEAVALIPEDADVVASTFILPNLSQRKVIYELEKTENTGEYYVLDLSRETDEYDVEDFLNDSYETVFYEEDVVAVFKNMK